MTTDKLWGVPTIREELIHLEIRAGKLAREKSYLQLVINLINRVSAAQGLDNMIETLLGNILEVIGGTNIILYYRIDGALFYADAFSRHMPLEGIGDDLVNRVFTTREPIELEQDFSNTQVQTGQLAHAYTWAFPLKTGPELIGVIKLENLQMAMDELYGHLPAFFAYVASALKNEIFSHTRLKRAYDQLSEMNEELKQEINEREYAEEELIRAKEDWERTFDAVPDLIALIDTSHRIIRMNRAMADRLKCPSGQMVGKRCYETIHALHEPIENCPHARMLLSGVEEHSEVVEKRLGGTFDVCTIPLHDKTGQVVGSVHVAHDITERKRNEDELRRSRDELEARVAERTADLQQAYEQLKHELVIRKRAEADLRKFSEEIHDLYNRAPCGYHSLDSDGMFIRINDTELQWLGYTREEMIDRMRFSDIITERSLATFRNSFPLLKERGWVRDLEFELLRKDGSILPVLLSATAINDENGNYLMNRATIYDITERKKEEERLVLAKAANPLSGLPGNESIQHVINDKLLSNTPFDIAYIDIDNFKPYNDYYGFQKGDVVIKRLAEIISTVALSDAGDASFCGHIGGDDFILITVPNRAEKLAAEIIRKFETHLELFHGSRDFQAGLYTAVNRKGVEESFGLLSLSFGILNTLLTPIDSYAQLASIATEVKRSAKKKTGSSIVVNRRSQLPEMREAPCPE